MSRPKLECTHEQYEELSAAVFNARERGDAPVKIIKVDRAALAALIIDHGRLLKHHHGDLDGFK